MNEQNGNITVEEGNLASNKHLLSQNQLSSIDYSEAFSYLGNQNIEQDHLQMKNLSWDFEGQEFRLTLFQISQEDQQQYNLGNSSENGVRSESERQRIVSVGIKKSEQKTIRLPNTTKQIAVEIEVDRQVAKLQGNLHTKSNYEHESELFNKKGEKKGLLKYQIKRIVPQKQQQLYVIQESLINTLNSADFQSSKTQKQQSQLMEDVDKLIKIDKELRQTIEKIQFEEESKDEGMIQRSQRRKKHYYEDDDERISEVDYREEDEDDLYTRINAFKKPIPTTTVSPNQNQIDFKSIQRNQEELGISQFNIEEKLYPKRLRDISKDLPPTFQEIYHSTLNTQYLKSQSSIKESKVSRKNCDYGIGTYSPLKSRFTSNRTSIKESRKSQFRVKSDRRYSLKGQKETPRVSYKSGQSKRSSQMCAFEDKNRNTVDKLQVMQYRSRQQQTQRMLFLDKKVYEILIEQPNEREQCMPLPITHQIKHKKHHSCKDSPLNPSQIINPQSPLHTGPNSSELYPHYNLSVTNLSLTFQRHTSGFKHIYLECQHSTHNTEELKGNNLIWIGKDYKFNQISKDCELLLIVKGEQRKIYGRVKIAIKDILRNKKQNYHQCLLLGDKQILGSIVIGYKLTQNTDTIDRFIYQPASVSHSMTQLRRKQSNRGYTERDQQEQQSYHRYKLPKAKANPIRARKYLGGCNIKIGKAHRFATEQQRIPGPGNYQFQSAFSRHAVKEY